MTNRKGYDNQPYFTPDNKVIYYTAIYGDGQADIYKYDLGKKKSIAVTQTPVSEYSPMLYHDKKHLTAVVVEADSTQRIWKYSLDGKQTECLIPNEDSVGYYSWLNKDSLLFYKLTHPHSLVALNFSTGQTSKIAENPTRSFKPTGVKNQFFFVIKENDSNEIYLYNTRTKMAELYCKADKNDEDFIWDPVLGLIRSHGSKLLRYNDEIKTWLELCDLSSNGIRKITRFAISPNGSFLAIVSNQ